METNSQKNHRIAKNTILLYIRTLITLIVSLYTSRIILNVLGVDNYGIYNVVGGAISMFSIFSGSFSGAISRFITFGLGKKDIENLKKIFSTSVNIQIGLSILIFVIAEIAGVWMLNTTLNIPTDRMYAAYWVLQFSILSFIVGLISTPYNACIIAHEHMKMFAYMGILEVILKLIFVAILYFSPFEKLIVYSFLLFLINLILRIIYGVYCKRNFEECTYHFIMDKDMFREMTGFASWGFFGNTAYIFNTQGVNILVNIFFGVVFNAARGIVTQVEGAIMQFIHNFTTAISPQITKSYASGDREYMFSLICRGAKFSVLLLLYFLIPIELEVNILLELWLGTVPENAPLFLQLSLIGTAITLLGNTGLTAVMATGDIRNYQLIVTLTGCLVFPLTWIVYKLGYPAFTTYIIYAVIYSILNGIRLLFMRKLLGFEISVFVRKVIFPVSAVSIVSSVIPFLIHINMDQSIIRLMTITGISFLSISASIYILGLDTNERKIFQSKLKNKSFLIKRY